MDVTPKEEIYLKENQLPHVERLMDILIDHYCAFDMSMMGAGKTYTTSYLSLELEFAHVIVVCPASVESKWKGMSRYGVKLHTVISYESLTSRNGKQPKHGLLERHDEVNTDKSGKTERVVFFTATPLLNGLLKDGALIVFDEAQKFKNKNDRFYACQALAKSVHDVGGTSRFMLLSGTPIDKEEHAINMMRMMNFIRRPILAIYDKEDRVTRLYGAQELINYCRTIDANETERFLRANPFTSDNVKHVCYLMFQQILKPAITSAMPSPKLDIDCKNGYYRITDLEDKENLMAGIASLSLSAFFNEKTGTVAVIGNSFGKIQKALMKIEKAKVNAIARVAKNQLERDPNCKVGIFYNFTESIFRTAEILKEYNPIVFYGQIKKELRQGLVDKFQEPNLNHRLFIGNIAASSTGIDLDDKYGQFPRYAFASPNYNILDLHQLTRRFVRLDTKSTAIFRFFYGDVARKETSILNALARKSGVMKDTLEGQVEEGVVFPGEYENVFENKEGEEEEEESDNESVKSATKFKKLFT